MTTWNIKHMTIGEGSPKIIMPLVGATQQEILQEAIFVKEQNPDVVEWRVDFFEEVDDIDVVCELLGKLREIYQETLLLFTFRSLREGGNKDIGEDFYIQLNEAAIKSNMIDLVDIELFSGEAVARKLVSVAKEHKVYVVMSNHDFEKTPEKDEIVKRLCKMQEYGADIPKIAVMPTNPQDVLTLLAATYIMKTTYANGPIITMSMGGTGLISRISGELFGSSFTFASGKTASAPGQIPISELRGVLDVFHKRM